MSEHAILDEVRQKYDCQSQRLDDVRTRAATLLSSSAIVAGLFGFHLTDDARSGWRLVFLVIALVAFAEVVFSTVAISWPIGGWNDGAKLGPWIELLEQKAATVDQFPTELAAQLHSAQENNEPFVETRMNLFRRACVSLGVEVVCWAIAVAV